MRSVACASGLRKTLCQVRQQRMEAEKTYGCGGKRLRRGKVRLADVNFRHGGIVSLKTPILNMCLRFLLFARAKVQGETAPAASAAATAQAQVCSGGAACRAAKAV